VASWATIKHEADPLNDGPIGVTPAPNPALQLTASRAIVGFLEARCGALAAAECQPVGRLGSVVDIPFDGDESVAILSRSLCIRSLCWRGSLARAAACPLCIA